jgi:trimethylamine:corrinoid methyltransferase-like protein
MATLMRITEQGGAGSIQAAAYYSHQALALIDESMGYLKKMAAGYNINDETMGVADIDACMEKGEYLSSKLTMKYLRKEPHYRPSVLDWRQLSNWEEKPDTVVERAEAKVREILARPKPEPLASEVTRELDRIMAAAEKEFQ